MSFGKYIDFNYKSNRQVHGQLCEILFNSHDHICTIYTDVLSQLLVIENARIIVSITE